MTTVKGRSRELTKDPKDMLKLFDFSYYRRIIDPEGEDEQSDASVTDDWKVIQLFKNNDTRKPRGATALKNYRYGDFEAIGVNLPICFNLKENVKQYYLDKQTRGKIINKGNALYRPVKLREDAGVAMIPITRFVKDPLQLLLVSKKVPATVFANGAMKQSQAVKDDWCNLKLDSRNNLPVPQEWCHLRGHHDGGDEYPGNFVSGSYHCNTEQLAIEEGQRRVTHQTQGRYLLHSTAYLLRDAEDYRSNDPTKRTSQVLKGNYLDEQSIYQSILKYKTAPETKKRRTNNDNDMEVETPVLRHGDVAPLAAYFRYKVMQCEGKETGSVGGNRPFPEKTISKYFDFIFEGQSEFIDINQYRILNRAVQFALAGDAAFKEWYAQEIE